MAVFLITGGLGFIGSHLADSLIEAGHEVRILDDLSTGRMDRKPLHADLVVGDVCDRRVVSNAMIGADGCFHLAAVASVELGNRDWLGTHRVNMTGSITVFDSARARGIPVVYASSAAVYGETGQDPVHEDIVRRPLSAYAADKLGSEQHAFVAGKVHQVRTCGLRFFNVYGPRQDPSSPYSGVISIFCDRIKQGGQVTIFGDGGQTRDFVFVSDVVRSLESAMAHASEDGPVFNVCSGRPTSILHLVQTIADIEGNSVFPRFDLERAGDIRHSLGDPTQAERKLGFRTWINLPTGLRSTLQTL